MRVEVPVANKLKLSHARAQLQLSQARLSELAGVSILPISRAERGETIQLLSAMAILTALNAVRAERGLPALSLSDVEWSVQGE